VQRDVVSLLEQLVERVAELGVAEVELWRHVEKLDLEADVLGENRELRADVAVADNAEELAPHLVAPLRHLEPGAAVALHAAVAKLARERDDLADHELGDRARVGEGRVKDRDAARLGKRQVHAVRPDAKAADAQQLRRVLEDLHVHRRL
jgi:hypothetical protein